jgi:clan AA aspartic protease (TIGR02281 family)
MKEKFHLIKKKIIVTPSIKGIRDKKDFNFIVDTGASVSIIDEAIAFALGFDTKKLKTERLTTVSGSASSKMLRLPKIDLLGKQISNFEVKVMSLPLQITLLADGLIGMDFLENFQRIKIDFDEQTIEV